MGTSSSYGGPKGNSPLLPPWAQPGLPQESGEDDQGGGEQAPQPGRTVPPPMVNFQGAKSRMTRFANSGGGRAGVRRVARGYVSARGGSRRASQAALGGRAGTGRLGAFLSDVVNRGAEAASRSLGLAGVVGRDAEVVFAEIANALASNGATLEDAAARRATDEALYSIYRRIELVGGDLAELDRLDEAAVREVLQDSVAGYIYHRWLQELGERIESNAISAKEATILEREVKDYVTEVVKLDLASVDVLRTDWEGSEGSRLIEDLYADAYALLGEE